MLMLTLFSQSCLEGGFGKFRLLESSRLARTNLKVLNGVED